jgi:hypothetical protein
MKEAYESSWVIALVVALMMLSFMLGRGIRLWNPFPVGQNGCYPKHPAILSYEDHDPGTAPRITLDGAYRINCEKCHITRWLRTNTNAK